MQEQPELLEEMKKQGILPEDVLRFYNTIFAGAHFAGDDFSELTNISH